MTKGLTNFAIDTCLEHLSLGRKLDQSFYDAMNRLYIKWRNKNPPLYVIETTCKVCRLQPGLRGQIAYRIARFKRKRKRKKIRKLLATGLDLKTLRHDSI
jgi:hypothetical protein